MSHALGEYAVGIVAVFAILSLAALFAFYRIVRGPSLPDRVVAFDLFTVITIGLLATASVAYDRSVLLDAAIILALVSFLATIALADYIHRRSQEEPRA